jgi:hypothetical protein
MYYFGLNFVCYQLTIMYFKPPVMRRFIFLLSMLSLILITACSKQERKGLLPMVTGKPGEIILVIDPYLWESDLGKFFVDFCNMPVEALPVDEPSYSLVHIPADGLNRIFKGHRNIILTDVSDQYKESRIIVQRNVWAYPQLLIKITGPKDSSLIAYLNENRDKLKNLLEVDERNRIIENYRKNRAKGIDEMLKQEHHVSISVPAGYDVGVDSADFVWLTHEVADMTQGILIYNYPYTDTNTFSADYLVNKRNEFVRKYVPGPVDGSYMKTESDYPVIFTENVKNGEYMAELRGLWRLEKAFMGGPFISHTMLDEPRNRVVTVEGFVYAPSLDKRLYIREVEAILYTFDVVD